MRILHYMEYIEFRYGGPPRAVVELAEVMHRRGHQVTLATTVDRDVPESWRRDGGPAVRLLAPPRGPLKRLPPASLAMAADEIRRSEVVHLHGVWEPANLQVAALCRRLGRPYVISLRGMLDDWAMSQKPLKKRLYLAMGGRRYLEGAAVVHCTAAGERMQASRRFGRARAEVVPNLIDLEPYAEPPDPAEAETRWPVLGQPGVKVLFLSRIHPSKGLSILIDTVAALRREGCLVHLLVAGTGDQAYTDSMQVRAAAAGIAKECTWTGFVDGQLKRSLYAACDLFALPTSQENFGFVLFEALASGTAVVTTDQVDTREELARSGGALIVPQSTDAFTAAIREFVEGRRDAAAMGRAGRAWALAELATGRVAAQFEALYRGS